MQSSRASALAATFIGEAPYSTSYFKTSFFVILNEVKDLN